MKLKKIMLFVIVIVVTASVAVGVVACKDKGPEPAADLVAVRINNFMAEWENIDYNFTYEGSSALKVSVPYTNYLQVNNLVVSPGAEYKVYEDETKTKEVADLEKIYVDGEKTLYIDVKNGEKTNSYSVSVNVKQTNLPPEEEIAEKQYDNRGGHVYIPEDAETVEVDGIIYEVGRAWNLSPALKAGKNIIAVRDGRIGWAEESLPWYFKGNFNGNNYTFIDSALSCWVYTIEENAIVQNMVIKQSEGTEYRIRNQELCNSVCNVNVGTIRNVYVDVNYVDFTRNGYGDQVYFPQQYGFYANVNYGKIENCLNVGNVTSKFNSTRAMLCTMVTVQTGEMINCVNTGRVEWVNAYLENSGAGAIGYMVNEDEAVFKGVYNLGTCVMTEYPKKYIDKKLDGLFFTTKNGKEADLSGIKNYV